MGTVSIIIDDVSTLQPYGVNVPGPSVKYKTTSVEGDVQHSCGKYFTYYTLSFRN